MKYINSRLFRLSIGLFLYSLGIYLTLQANIGYAAWDVFHDGLAKTTHLSFGISSIYVGLVIVAITMLLGEPLGIGSILNMLVIGLLIDWLMAVELIPLASGLLTGSLMLISGLFVIAVATIFYMGSGYGSGPRDSLMVALTKKTNLPVGLVRGGIEVTIALIGYALGGMIGIGTIISAVAVGFIIQFTFETFKFDSTAIEHENLGTTFKGLIKVFG